MLTFGSLFSGGIDERGGGGDYGLSLAGWKKIWEVEITRGRNITEVNEKSLETPSLVVQERSGRYRDAKSGDLLDSLHLYEYDLVIAAELEQINRDIDKLIEARADVIRKLKRLPGKL